MIRTKHLIICILVALGILIGVFVFKSLTNVGVQGEMDANVLFGIPQDTYAVVTRTEEDHNSERTQFIAKVQNALRSDMPNALVEEIIDVPPPAPIEVPVEVVPVVDFFELVPPLATTSTSTGIQYGTITPILIQ